MAEAYIIDAVRSPTGAGSLPNAGSAKIFTY